MRSTNRARILLIAATVVAGACALTACEGDEAGAKTGTSSATPATGAGEPGGGSSPDKGSTTPDTGGAADDDSAADDSPAGADRGVSGAFAGGTVEYLAPQKYIVSVGGKDQQFYVSDSTAVYGAGVLCGKYDTKATTRCSLADLESTTKSGSVAADVVLESGVATRITERPAPDEGPAVDDQ